MVESLQESAETGWQCPACGPLTREGLSLYESGQYNLDSLRFGPWCRACGARTLFTPPLSGVRVPAGMAESQRPSPFVVLISGSCASGKSTVSRLLAERHYLVQIDGDWVLALRRAELGRSVDYRELDPDLRRMAHGVTWLGKERRDRPDRAARRAAGLPALLWRARNPLASGDPDARPKRAAATRRGRSTWPHPTPAYWIDAFPDALLGATAPWQGCFYDSSAETPEQTAETVWRMIQMTARH